jgi:hypothetical protein
LDLDNVYKLPILCQDVNDGNDISHTLTRKDDDKVQEPEEVPANDSSSDSSEADSAQRCHKQEQGSHHHEMQLSSVCTPAQKSSHVSRIVQVQSTIVWSRLIFQ